MSGIKRSPVERVRAFSRSVGEVATFGLGMVGALLALFLTLTTFGRGWPLTTCTVVLFALGVGVAYRWRLCGVAAGIALTLFLVWMLLALAGEPL